MRKTGKRQLDKRENLRKRVFGDKPSQATDNRFSEKEKEEIINLNKALSKALIKKHK